MNSENETPNRLQQGVGVTKDYLLMPLFEEGSAKLAPEDDFQGLMLRWDALRNHVVRTIGYADMERETEELASMRAEAVHQLLLRRGIAPSRFDAVSWSLHGPPSAETYRHQLRRACVVAYNTKLAPDEWQPYFGQLQFVHESLGLGCSEDKVYDVILRALATRMLHSKEPPWVDLDPGDLPLECSIAHPFEARSATLVAVLSSDRRLNDLWLQENTLGILPLKRAVYDARLGIIKSGMQIEELYSWIGERAPERYYTGQHGSRVVEFRYRGFGRDCCRYVVDAASGRICRASVTAG